MTSDNEKLKSALEIALERAQKLGGLSSEEKQKLKDEKLESVGLALSKRYLKGLPIRDVEMELTKYKEDRKAVVRYLLSYLADGIDIGEPDTAERVLEAVKHFSGASAAEKISSIINQYQSEMKQARQEGQLTLGAAKIKELKQMGISGSAVKPAIETSPEWIQTQQRLESDYKKRLKEMIQLLQAL